MAKDRTAIAILAGGRGTRLWPLSRPDRPKQFVPILPDGSMLQATFARARRIVGPEGILVVGNREHAHLYREQLPDLPPENLILEPTGLGTGPCVGLTASIEDTRGRFDVVVTVPADHVILEPDEWIAAIETAAGFAAENDRLVSVAALPDGPQVKFGYLQIGDRIGGTDRNPVFEGIRFVEKPDQTLLEEMLAAGTCLRNMGTLAFRPGSLLRDLTEHLPDVASALAQAAKHDHSDGSLDAAYSTISDSSIDRALLQKVGGLAVVAAKIDSIDAGDFASIGQALETDERGNAIRGDAIMVDSSSNTVVSEHATVAVVGAEDLVVVVDGDTVLVCPKDETQRIGAVASKQ